MSHLDTYGGTDRIKSEATGYFRVEKIFGRWWFITPEGNGFLSLGINHIDSSSLKYPDNIEVWNEKYKSEKEFLQGVRSDLLSWGLNTVGWTPEIGVRHREHSNIWAPHQYEWLGMPYCHCIPFTSMEMWNNQAVLPDVFSAEFEEWCDFQARQCCSDLAEDPNLIGYFYSDIPAWGQHETRDSWADRYDLSTKEGRIELQMVAAKYYQVIHDSIRRYDSNHLLLGDRYNGQAPLPEVVLKAMMPTVDVLSIQHFPPLERFIEKADQWYSLTEKPIMNADVGFHEKPFGNEGAHGVHTQSERGEKYVEWAGKCFEKKWCVGWHWCGYIENC